MDVWSHNQSSANPRPISLKNSNNCIQIGDGTEAMRNRGTSLQPDSPSFVGPKGVKRKWGLVGRSAMQPAESFLNLCLGHSSSSSDSKGSTATMCTSIYSAKEGDEESSMEIDLDFTLHLSNEKCSGTEKSGSSKLKTLDAVPNVDLQLSLSSGPTLSDVTVVNSSSAAQKGVTKIWSGHRALNSDDSTGSPPFSSSVAFSEEDIPNYSLERIKNKSISPYLSSIAVTAPKSSVSCTSGIIQSQQQRNSGTKQCQFEGCLKGARGASGLCISHGGGRRCQRSGCHKGAEGRTAFCKAHGGGRRCEFLGCTKSAEGRTDFCIAHGGGRRCSHDSCSRAARGKSGLCIRHGGGKRCHQENCTKSAEGLSGLCISHGGGRRCQYPECGKGAQGSTMFCKAHGGGKRCTYPGCKKGAEGSTSFCKGHGGGKRCSFHGGGICPKSVHGGTLFCVAHGGGKRCAVTECTRSARGRTDFCVRHGGGKRCKIEGCGKSAQGSTDFCKAHGGGKRCSWGHPDCEFGNGETPCSLFARGRTGLCASHSALVQDQRVHGGATLGTVVQDSKTNQAAKMKQILIFNDTSTDVTMFENNSIVTSNGNWNHFGLKKSPIPEGRVHGGNLMAAISGNHGFVSSNKDKTDSSDPGKSSMTCQTWKLDKMGALEWSKVVHENQAWRLLTCIWLHAGIIHLLANMLSLVFIGIRLEQQFGFIRVGVIYLLSGIGGSILSCLFIQNSISVGASGALFGLLGAMLSELLTNWTIYTNKAAALFTLLIIIAINLAVGILPHVDNFAHIGGFFTGFLVGFMLLFRPQFGWAEQHHIPNTRLKSKYTACQYILGIISTVLLIIGLTVELIMLFKGENANGKCSWCHYLSCVPTSRWSCNN